MLALPAPPVEAPAPPRVGRLKHADRCDRCGSRAYVAAEIAGVDLLFCGHHFARWEVAITASAAEILDERWQLEDAESNRRTSTHL